MPDDKAARLLRIFETMQEVMPRFVAVEELKRAGRIEEADRASAGLIDALDRQLAAVVEHDRAHPGTPFGAGPSVEQLLDALFTRADLLDTLGKAAEAEAVRERAMALGPEHRTAASVAERKRQRAASLLTAGRYAEAAVALAEARDEFLAGDDTLAAAHVAIDLAELYEWLGDTARAKEEAGRTRALIEPALAGAPPTFADAFTALLAGRLGQAGSTARLTAVWMDLAQVEARAARDLGEFDAAVDLFERVRQRTSPDIVPAIDFQFARIEIERGRPERGLEMIAAILPRMTGLLLPKVGALRSWRVEALLALDRPGEALPEARRSVAELTAARDLDSLWKAQWRAGRVHEALGAAGPALISYQDAVGTVTALRRAPLGYRLESTFMADKLPLFDAAIGLAAASDDAAACLRLVEQLKSRTLTAILTTPPATHALPRPPDDLGAAVDDLSRQLDALEYRAYKTGWDEAATTERDRLHTERTRLLERLRLADPRWHALSRPVAFEPAAVTRALAARGQAALSLHYRPGRVVALLLLGNEITVGVRELSPETERAIDTYRRNLESGRPDPVAFDPAGLPPLAADRLVPAALLERALGASSLVVVPHGPLHLLPWAALVTGGHRLFERCPVGILPNVACLGLLDGQAGAPTGVALLGAPSYEAIGLPELALARQEIAIIADLFAGRLVGGPMVGAEATQAAYTALVDAAPAAGGVLHLASHGDFVAGDPENSGLLLADGRLDAAEIARRPIRYAEVVLSACASGYRPTRVGEVELAADDIVGLPGAFLEAGARAVLVSIPRARDDATLSFMTRYYERRVAGDPPLTALAATQRAMLAAGDFGPSLWAGFSLYGCV